MSLRRPSEADSGPRPLWVLAEGDSGALDVPMAVVDALVPRAAWQPDASVVDCVCGRRFGIVRRRHHCRVCGSVRCSACSGKTGVHLVVASAEEAPASDGSADPRRLSEGAEGLSLAPAASIGGTVAQESVILASMASSSSVSAAGMGSDADGWCDDPSSAAPRLVVTQTAYVRVCQPCLDAVSSRWRVLGQLRDGAAASSSIAPSRRPASPFAASSSAADAASPAAAPALPPSPSFSASTAASERPVRRSVHSRASVESAGGRAPPCSTGSPFNATHQHDQQQACVLRSARDGRRHHRHSRTSTSTSQGPPATGTPRAEQSVFAAAAESGAAVDSSRISAVFRTAARAQTERCHSAGHHDALSSSSIGTTASAAAAANAQPFSAAATASAAAPAGSRAAPQSTAAPHASQAPGAAAAAAACAGPPAAARLLFRIRRCRNDNRLLSVPNVHDDASPVPSTPSALAEACEMEDAAATTASAACPASDGTTTAASDGAAAEATAAAAASAAAAAAAAASAAVAVPAERSPKPPPPSPQQPATGSQRPAGPVGPSSPPHPQEPRTQVVSGRRAGRSRTADRLPPIDVHAVNARHAGHIAGAVAAMAEPAEVAEPAAVAAGPTCADRKSVV